MADSSAAVVTGTVTFGSVPTELGDVLAAVTGEGLVATAFTDSPHVRAAVADRLGLTESPDNGPAVAVLTQLREYFAGRRHEFDVDIDWRLMSASQRRVLGTLYETVPYGTVVTYGELAARSGSGIPPRGIGSIMGSNPIPIVVPCHRVVAGDGLGGFSGGSGVESKRHLLTLEGYLPPGLW
ncbi:cysteine methyltransferase [Actinophytocola xinjiangensis]|uniref:Cysteine methyltransferase n=1 Tax=Actinophytocola xinjiangensis TaxID=485602 RepID=A0A7Z0WN33_9PSEU|nr:methylated-DNA--[protein]-cysteine S-methyltransferase [Actinophytocola xinjiangensis]OLF11437.1 cysteine methyltransferase [Actinophytocola xinjiangensis]